MRCRPPWGAPASGRALPSDRGEVRVLHTFSADDAANLGGPEWLRRRRTDAIAAFESTPLPSEKEEVWRYSPIDRLDLDAFAPTPVPSPEDVRRASEFTDAVVADLGGHARAAIVVDGRLANQPAAPSVVAFGGLGDKEPPAGELVGGVLVGGDALARLNDAFFPDAVVIDVAPGAVVDDLIVVVHWSSADRLTGGLAPATFPRTVVRLGRGARAQVLEVVAGPEGTGDALVVPVTEIDVGDEATLSYVALQVLGDGAWHLGRLAARVGRDATVRTFTVGLGAAYDRARSGVAAVGPGAHCELRSAYLGVGDQIHDVRTLQDHQAPRTTSDLLCKGVVAGGSRSIYSGLIRVRHGAVRSEAFQTNNNLVLGDRAHADSVPNLDIEENDVRCSHASTVGPVDEDQRFYLESRGVPPARAERLIVLGFFDDIVDRSPVPSVTGRLRKEVGARLAGALGSGGPDRG